MKKLLFTFLASLSLISYGQAPQEISYQGVARNASGSLLANQNIGIKLDLHQGSAGGAIVFSETHSKTTNSFGLFTLGIGSVNTAAFTAINWAGGPYFMEVSMDPAGGSSYTSVGTQQFMSVPYALYAKTAGNATPTPTIIVTAPNTVTSAGGSYTINIPAAVSYSAGTGISVSGNTISNTAPDQTVVLNAAGATTVTGTYPSFTINTPTAQAYSAGNGIDITSGVISNTAAAVTPTIIGTGATTVTGVYPNLTINTPTVAPDQAVSLTGIGTATVTGAYPNFTVNVPSGASLPTAFNGQFLYNNGTIWDTLPRNNLYFDGTNFGIGTTSPQATFHVVGAGKFNASVSTPQIYANAMNLAVGTFTNAGDVLTNDGAGNATWQAIPSPTLSYNNGTNVLSLSQGTTVTTATLVGTGSNTVSIVGSGLASVTPTTGSTFTVSVPSPTITGTGATTVTGTYPNITISSPTMAVATPPTIVGAGSSTVTSSGNSFTVTTPTSATYTNGAGISIASGSIITNTAPNQTVTLNGTGATTVTGTYPNFTINSPTVAASTPPTIIGTGATTVTSSGNTFTVNTPASQTYTNGAGISVTSGSIITNTAPNQTITLNGTGATSVTGTYPNYTVSSTSTPSTTLVQGTNITLNNSGNTYTVIAVTPTITGTGATTVTGTYPNLTINTPTATAGTPPTIIGTGATTVTSSGNTFTVNTPTSQTYTNGTGISITSGSIITNTAPNQVVTLNGTGATTVTGGYPNFTVSSPSMAATSITGTTGITVTGTAPNYTLSSPNQSLTINSNSLSITGGNTITLPASSTTTLTQGANVTVSGSAPNYTVSAPAYSISIPGGNVVQITNGVSTSTSAINATSLTLTGTSNNVLSAGGNTVALNTYTPGTGITMTGTAPNYTLSSPNQSLSISGNSLSITGGNTVTIPPSTINGTGTGIATVTTSDNNFTVNVPTPSFAPSTGVLSFGTNTLNVSPTLSLTGTTLASGPSTNSVSLSSLAVWSISGGVLHPTTLANSVGVGTSGPLSDKMEINHASTTGNTHLHLKQTGGDAFSRMKFTNAVAPSKFWLSTVTSAASDANSGYNFFYHNGATGRNLFTVAGNGKVSVNPFSLSNYNALLEVNGGFELDSTMAVNGLSAIPPLSTATSGVIYFDRPAGKFKVSENGGAYVNMIGGGSSPWIQGTGIITQTNLGDKVGIGTATPTAQLHVYGSSDPLLIAVENTAGAFKTGYKIKTNSQEWFIGKETGGSNGLRFSDITNGQVRMVVETSGNVGIGTTAPTANLHVINTGTVSSAGIFDITNAANANNTLEVYNSGIGTSVFATNTSSTNAAARFTNTGQGMALSVENTSNTDPTAYILNNGTGPALSVDGKLIITDGTQANGRVLTSDGSGNASWQAPGAASSPWSSAGSFIYPTTLTDKVGIGTAVPDFPLDIRTTSDVLLNLSSSASTQGTQAGLRLSMFDGYTGKQYTLAAEKSDATVNSGASDFIIKSHYSTAGGTLNNMVIRDQDLIFNESKTTGSAFGNVVVANGNFGVGNPTPAEKLDVVGNVKFSGALMPNNNPGTPGMILTSNGAGSAPIWNVPPPSTDWSLTGNSGTNPVTDYAGTTDTDFLLKGGTGANIRLNSTLNSAIHSASLFTFNTNSSGSNPGVTITGPTYSSAMLSVQKNAAIGTAGTPLGSITFGAAGSAFNQAEIAGYRDATSGSSSDIPTALTFWTTPDGLSTSAERMRINNAGRVGIGTSAPLQKLHITDVTNGASLRLEGPNASGSALNSTIEFFETSTFKASMGWASQSSQQYWFVYDGATAQNMVYKAGNLGIGTQAPGGKLHVVSAASSTVGLLLDGGHVKSTQTTAPTTGSVSVSGGGITAAVPSLTNATDVKGKLTAVITTTTLVNPGNNTVIRVTFNKGYSIIPAVVVTPLTDLLGLSYFVTNVSTTSFDLTVKNSTAGSISVPGTWTVNFNYMVIE